METASAETIQLPVLLPEQAFVAPRDPRARVAADKYSDIKRLGIVHWYDTLERVARNQLMRSNGRRIAELKPRPVLSESARILTDDDLATLVAAYLRHRPDLASSCSRQFLQLVDTAHAVVTDEIRRRRVAAQVRH